MDSIERATRWHASLVALGVIGLVVTTAAQAPPQSLLVMLRISKTNGTLAIVDPATRTIVTRVRTGEDPHGVDVSPDGKFAFVANTSGDDGESLSIIDLQGGKEIRRLSVKGSRPHDVQFAGRYAFFTGGGRKAIGRYDPERNQIEWIETGPHATRMMAISADANTIYATSQPTKSVIVLEGVSGAPGNCKLTAIPLGQEGEGLALSPDEKEIWTANPDNSGVSVVDLATRKVETIAVKTDHANRLAITPDGRHVFVMDRDIGVTIIVDRASRKEIKRIAHSGTQPGEAMGIFDVQMTADGSRAFVTVAHIPDTTPRSRARPVVGGKHHIAVIDLKTLEVTGRIDTDIPGDEMAWVISGQD